MRCLCCRQSCAEGKAIDALGGKQRLGAGRREIWPRFDRSCRRQAVGHVAHCAVVAPRRGAGIMAMAEKPTSGRRGRA
jgi:hypothetical protein